MTFVLLLRSSDIKTAVKTQGLLIDFEIQTSLRSIVFGHGILLPHFSNVTQVKIKQFMRIPVLVHLFGYHVCNCSIQR